MKIINEFEKVGSEKPNVTQRERVVSSQRKCVFLRERNGERKVVVSSFPASSADDFSGQFAADSHLSVDHGSIVPEAPGFKCPNPSHSQPSFEPIQVENENEDDNKNGDFPVDHASAVPETYGS